MKNTRKINWYIADAREKVRKLFESPSPIKLMIMSMVMVLLVVSLIGPLLVRYHIRIPIPPLAVGGGIDMDFDVYEAEANYSKPDSIRVQRLTNTTE